MNRIESVTTNEALKNKELKAKHLSGSTFVLLLNFKRELISYLNTVSEVEQEVIEAYEMTPGEQKGTLVPKNQEAFKLVQDEFLSKMKEVQSQKFTPSQMNFIPQEEFRSWTAEADTDAALTLATFLMKE